jgi:cyclophilin family peptidyl-prolyl cis-trans isomerase
MAQLLKEYPQDVRLIYRHFPLLSIHDRAALATQAAEAAGIQGKFWEMHDLLFERQGEWGGSGVTVEQFETWLVERATELGLDVEKFKTDLNSPELVALAQKAWEDGQTSGLPGTPFLLINGQPYQGDMSYATLKSLVDYTMLSQREFKECPEMLIDQTKEYIATIKTEKGDIVLKLFADKAPLAVNNFVFLAKNGWYDGVTFHRVLPGFVAQAGDPSGSGFGGPGYTFINEIDPSLNFDRAGLVGMANGGTDTNGSQFFITFKDLEQLNGGYTVFGEVIEGMDVAESLTPRDPQSSSGSELPPGDKIISITIEEK